MPSSCCAVGCTKRYSKEEGVRMFRFPKDEAHRRLWIQAIRRDKWEPNSHSRVCCEHFISGKFLAG